MKLYNRWFQLVASLVAMIMIANLQYSWTLFVKPMQAGNGWKLSDVQWAFTLFILFQTWVQPLDGWLIDRMGPRGLISVAGLLCGLGWAGMGYATSLPMLYTLYCLAGIGAAFVYSGSIGSALKWFKEHRGLASGIMAAGFGGGTALFIPFISSTIRTHGYRTAFIWTGLFQGVVILLVAQFLRHPPAEARAAAATTPASTAQLGRRQFTTAEMLRTPQFYMLYAMFVMMATGGLLVTANAGPMSQSWGLTAAALTLAATLSPLANGGSRIFWGWASDRIGREMSMVIAFTLQAICLLMVLVFGQLSGALFALTLVLVYFTWGEIYSLFPATVGDYFGTRHATSNYSVLYTAKGVASIIGGGVGALLYERSGSWSSGFYGSALMALVAAGLAFGLRASRSAQAKEVGVASPVAAR
ncbi:MAG TPA: oxalate/formate MFS antiporter [Vicinamibacterales bacterium]|jgi:OFA family oxalate/formate antiporter-like MFS transporter|nr:oxalate/formate MFS antiporter [Vicinamibacterales bacterium]